MALTKYPSGSVRELLAIAFPLMLSSFCLLAMVFTDRVFLAHFSGEAMNASLTAGTAAWAVAGSLIIFGGMAEVFVAQYNGARQFDQLGKPVWQMIWFAIGTLVLVFPLGIWGGPLLFRGGINFALETESFFWYMALCFSWPLLAAVSAFFVGRGKTRLIFGMSLLANGLNILLDWLLIFGVDGLWEPMGVKGAAIATGAGNLVQVAILLALFLGKENRQVYGTGKWGFDLGLFKKCVRVATPQAMFLFIEILGFTLFYMMIGHVGPAEMFVAGVCQSVNILLCFAAEGMGRGAVAVAGNAIGAQDSKRIFQVFWSGVKIHLGFFAIIAVLLVVFPNLLISLFFGASFTLEASGVSATPELMSAMRVTLQGAFVLCLGYLFFDAIRWLMSSILTAAGDTLFLFIFGVLGVPFALLLPTYWLIEKLHYGTIVAFCIANFFMVVLVAIFGFRLFSGRWQKIELIQSSSQSEDTEPEEVATPLP